MLMSSDARRPRDPPGKVLSDLLEKLKGSSGGQLALAAALVLVSVYGLFRVSGLSERLSPLPMPTATPTAVPTATSEPTATATVTPEATATTTDTPVPVVMLGTTVEVAGTGTDELRVRVAPGLDRETIGTVEDGTRLRITEGPESMDGFKWWRIKSDEGQEGWVAEDWLVPVAP
jgi:hypothetical protein